MQPLFDCIAELEGKRLLVEEALSHSNGLYTYEDVLSCVRSGELQVWAGLKKSFLITEVVQYPRDKVLVGFLAGGDLEELLDIMPHTFAWAKHVGCTHALLHGRKGWERVFSKIGAKVTATSMIVKLDDRF